MHRKRLQRVLEVVGFASNGAGNLPDLLVELLEQTRFQLSCQVQRTRPTEGRWWHHVQSRGYQLQYTHGLDRTTIKGFVEIMSGEYLLARGASKVELRQQTRLQLSRQVQRTKSTEDGWLHHLQSRR